MNKIFLTLALACLTGIAAHAQYSSNGYYRIKNATTERYMSLCDNKSTGVSMVSTTVDAGALVTKRNIDEILTDPGSVFYIYNVSDNQYNISAQGHELYNIIHYYIRLTALNDGTYRAWQIDQSQPLWLSDRNNNPTADQSYVDTKTSDTQRWYIMPVNEADNYIGVNPIFECNGKYYATFFAEFPFSFASSGMRAFYINGLHDNGIATYKYINGIVPAKTPVIIECSSQSPADNKLKIESSSPAAITDNLLTGVYFGMGVRASDHFNSTPFDATTMRVLGMASDGSLAINSEDTYMADIMAKEGTTYNYTYPTIKAIPHNTAYVSVDADTPAVLKLFEDGNVDGIEDISADDSASADIYALDGTLVRKNASSMEGLPHGIYLYKGRKVVVR